MAITTQDLELQSGHHMDQAKEWFEENKLLLNEAKTERITFQMDRWQQARPPIRLLGVYIDPRLTWRGHVDHLAKALSRGTKQPL